MDRQEIADEARRRAKIISEASNKVYMKTYLKQARTAAKGAPLRSKRPNGSVPEHIKRAERNAKVALHRGRNAGKTEDEAQAQARAAYLRSLAKSTKDETEREELMVMAEEQKAESNPIQKSPVGKEDTPLCLARRTENGAPMLNEDGERILCHQPAGWGTNHYGFGRCKYHGGSAPNGIISAEKEKIMTEIIEREIVFYGEAQEIDPIEALSQEVRRTAGHVAWLGEQIRNFERDGEGLTESSSQGRQKNIIIGMYQDERDRLVRVSKIAIDAGLAERSVQLAEAQGQMLAMVIRDILWDKALNLTPEQRHNSQDVVRRHLLALDTASQALPAVQTVS